MKQLLAFLFTALTLLLGLQGAQAATASTQAEAMACCEHMHPSGEDCCEHYDDQSCDSQCQCNLHCATGGHSLTFASALTWISYLPMRMQPVSAYRTTFPTPYLKQTRKPPRI